MLQYQKEEVTKIMINYKRIRALVVLLLSATILTTSNMCIDKVTAQTAVQNIAVTTENTSVINPLAIVKSPKSYLNKTITMNARFDKFSTLGLDYKSRRMSAYKRI